MTDPQVRIGHCSPDAPNVDVYADDGMILEDVPFGTISDYMGLPEGGHELRVTATGDDAAVIEASVDLAADSATTVLATGMLDEIEPSMFPDEPGQVPSGKAHVRFIHASPDAPRVNIAVRDGPTLFRRAKFRSATDYEQVDAGQYDIDVTPTGSDEAALSLPGLTFDGGSAYTAIAIGLAGDGTLDAVLIEDAMVEMAADD
jgi:hypothetical protein